MKVTLNWLRELVPIELETTTLCDRLSMGGLEVEGIEHPGAEIAAVVVAEIVSTSPHPNADRLTVCEVRTAAAGAQQVVCGAKNMGAGDRVAFAPPGTTLPGGRTIEQSEIRGVVSAGMLCSEAELGLSDEAAGILILDRDAPLGRRVAAHLGIEDTVIEISVTPNRGDCLSVIGIAREIAALTGQRLRQTRIKVGERGAPIGEAVAIRIDDPRGCARYCARLVHGVRIAPSPRWIQHRLSAVGIRPINNVVDVTNFVMIERGQPLHAFDFNRLPRPEIVVRRAGTPTTMQTLDGVTRRLEADDLLITTGAEPIAIAGVMGGADTEVTPQTTTVLLEAAWFDPASIRRTRRRLDLPSESSFRFERGVDVAGVPVALDRAAALLRQLAGGQVGAGLLDVYPNRSASAPIELRGKRVEELLGVSLSRSEIGGTLKAIGAGVAAGPRGSLTVSVPSFRSDLTREIDLIEEVARVVGYDRLPASMPAVALEAGSLPERLRMTNAFRGLLAAAGLYEVIPLSFCSARANQLFAGFGVAGRAVELLNPVRRDEAELRQSLLGGLVNVWRLNRNQGAAAIAAFAIGKVFWHDDTPREAWRLAGVLAGEMPYFGLGVRRQVEFADGKGVVEAVLDLLHVNDQARWQRLEENDTFHPGKSAIVQLGDQPIGVLGALHPNVEEELGLSDANCLFELDLEKLLPYSPPRLAFRGLPRFPAVVRDLALVGDQDFSSSRVVEFIRGWRSELVEDVTLFDEYVGAPIAPGKKSLAYSIAYRASDRTLTDEEVNLLHGELTAALQKSLPVELRQ
jgi:phenylalanyl-tRNA synthetase beta chain